VLLVSSFFGRQQELAKLEAALETVRRTGGGQFLSVRGRRQVGKSRLMEEFIARSGEKAVFYVASQLQADEELGAFREAVRRLPHRCGRRRRRRATRLMAGRARAIGG